MHLGSRQLGHRLARAAASRVVRKAPVCSSAATQVAQPTPAKMADGNSTDLSAEVESLRKQLASLQVCPSILVLS
jgi:uncharacterized protein YceH (UPF0502 family)